MNKAIIIISKIVEVGNWVGASLFAVLAIGVAIGKEKIVSQLSDIDSNSVHLDVGGFNMESAGNDPFSPEALVFFFIIGIIVCVLTALMFRNLYLAFKTAEGQTKYSEGKTPFQPSVVKMIKRIGIYCISIPIVELVMSIVGGIMVGSIETSVSFTWILLGLVVLGLSRFFAYGVEIQNDVEGLV